MSPRVPASPPPASGRSAAKKITSPVAPLKCFWDEVESRVELFESEATEWRLIERYRHRLEMTNELFESGMELRHCSFESSALQAFGSIVQTLARDESTSWHEMMDAAMEPQQTMTSFNKKKTSENDDRGEDTHITAARQLCIRREEEERNRRLLVMESIKDELEELETKDLSKDLATPPHVKLESTPRPPREPTSSDDPAVVESLRRARDRWERDCERVRKKNAIASKRADEEHVARLKAEREAQLHSLRERLAKLMSLEDAHSHQREQEELRASRTTRLRVDRAVLEGTKSVLRAFKDKSETLEREEREAAQQTLSERKRLFQRQ